MARGRRKRSQYHHYVPRFILRKWMSDEDAPQSPGPNTEPVRRRPRRDSERTDLELISTYHVDTEVLTINATPIAHVYGSQNMYKDPSNPGDVYHIEELLRELERQTARVLTRIDGVVSAQKNSIVLHKTELETLRKFLFTMPSRSLSCFRQFDEHDFDLRTWTKVSAFMERHNLPDARSAWLFSLKNILLSKHGSVVHDETILQTVREEFKKASSMQLEFYTAPRGSEFVLTDNGFGLEAWEQDMARSAADSVSYTYCRSNSFGYSSRRRTILSAISPHLVIALRSSVNPATPLSRDAYEENLGLHVSGYSFGAEERVYSSKYTITWPGNPFDAPYVEGGKQRFRIVSLPREQVEIVNTLILDNKPRTITFKTPSIFLSSVSSSRRCSASSTVSETWGQSTRESMLEKLEKQLKTKGVIIAPSLPVSYTDWVASTTQISQLGSNTLTPSNTTRAVPQCSSNERISLHSSITQPSSNYMATTLIRETRAQPRTNIVHPDPPRYTFTDPSTIDQASPSYTVVHPRTTAGTYESYQSYQSAPSNHASVKPSRIADVNSSTEGYYAHGHGGLLYSNAVHATSLAATRVRHTPPSRITNSTRFVGTAAPANNFYTPHTMATTHEQAMEEQSGGLRGFIVAVLIFIGFIYLANMSTGEAPVSTWQF